MPIINCNIFGYVKWRADHVSTEAANPDAIITEAILKAISWLGASTTFRKSYGPSNAR